MEETKRERLEREGEKGWERGRRSEGKRGSQSGVVVPEHWAAVVSHLSGGSRVMVAANKREEQGVCVTVRR